MYYAYVPLKMNSSENVHLKKGYHDSWRAIPRPFVELPLILIVEFILSLYKYDLFQYISLSF